MLLCGFPNGGFMKLLLSMILLFSVTKPVFAGIDEIEFTDNLEEISPVKIREIKNLMRTISPNETCMDEYLKRRKQLIIKLVASPLSIPLFLVGGAFAGAGLGTAIGSLSGASDPWAALGHMIGGGLIGGAASGVYAIVDTTSTGVQLNQINTVLKTLGEYYLEKEGRKTEKLYSLYLEKEELSPISKEEFVERIVDMDKQGTLCNGSLVKQPRIKFGLKLKYKVARPKDLIRGLI